MKGFDPIVYIDDDGLMFPDDIGHWGLKKYELFGRYCDIFTSGMKGKWDNLVYIDLFACAGVAKIKDEEKRIKTSSLIAASIPNKFTNYIVCELSKEYIGALKNRIGLYHKEEEAKFQFINGDCNENIDIIINHIPKGYKTLNFCFVDPFNFDIEFETIKKIASNRQIDFLILFATHMAGNRNYHNYIKPGNNTIEKFINNKNWRTKFLSGEKTQKDFINFLAESYDANMKSIGYITDPKLKCQIKTNDGHTLYYLAFYSKHPVGNSFYKKIEVYQNPQLKLF